MHKITKILIGTHNHGKFREISDLLPKKIIKISPVSLNIESPIENGKTFKENSELKANFFCKKSNSITLSDDSGLSIDCLNGEPGISPGQACVFYQKDLVGDKVLGGGWISKTFNKNYPHS